MHRREDDMVRGFFAKLHDEFSEVGFHHLVTRFFKSLVEMNLIGGHCLGLDDRSALFIADDPQNDVTRLGAGAGPMDFCAARCQFVSEFDEVFVQVIDGFPFCFSSRLAGGLPALESGAVFVADDLVFPEGGLDDLAMTEVAGEPDRLGFEFGGVAHVEYASLPKGESIRLLVLFRASCGPTLRLGAFALKFIPLIAVPDRKSTRL